MSTSRKEFLQLLTKYWDSRVEGHANNYDRKVFLRAVVEKMVEARSLSIPETSVYQVGQGSILSALQSDEVLRESVTNRLSFVHNILFDYAVARLLLDEQNIEEFIQVDKARTIFFRPSLVYFFHYLWFRDRALFWTVAFKFFSSELLPERARILPAITVCEAALAADDLEPLLAGTAPTNISGITATLRSLQALGGLNGASGERGSRYFRAYPAAWTRRSSMDTSGCWAGRMRAKATPKGPPSLRRLWHCSAGCGRQLRIYPSTELSLASVAAGRVLPLVIKNYSEDIAESRRSSIHWWRFGHLVLIR